MTDLVEIALISNVSVVTAALITGLFTLMAAHAARKAAEKAVQISEATANSVDGRMSEMLALTRKLAHGEGVEEQRLQTAMVAAAVKDAQVPIIQIAQPPTV